MLQIELLFQKCVEGRNIWMKIDTHLKKILRSKAKSAENREKIKNVQQKKFLENLWKYLVTISNFSIFTSFFENRKTKLLFYTFGIKIARLYSRYKQAYIFSINCSLLYFSAYLSQRTDCTPFSEIPSHRRSLSFWVLALSIFLFYKCK
jgi:hypothetical protein